MNNPCVGFGSRGFPAYLHQQLHLINYNRMAKLYIEAVNLFGPASEGVYGGAAGADELFRLLMQAYEIPTKLMKADWTHFGKSAGVLRNKQMADYVREQEGYAIGLWDGISRGTKHMMDYCQRWGIPTLVHEINVPEETIHVHRFNI